MKSNITYHSLDTLPFLQSLQKQVCDLDTVKCNGQVRVHIECNQGRYQNAVVITHSGNGRSIHAYLTLTGWSLVARKNDRKVWQEQLSVNQDPAPLLEKHIKGFLLNSSLYQHIVYNLRQHHPSWRYQLS